MTGEENAVSIGPLKNALGEEPAFRTGERVRLSVRFPIGHFRVPNYIRGKRGWIESVIEPPAINNEEEGYGRNAGNKRHYCRVAIPLKELWPHYSGSDKCMIPRHPLERCQPAAFCVQATVARELFLARPCHRERTQASPRVRVRAHPGKRVACAAIP